jgi:hypothetical protein
VKVTVAILCAALVALGVGVIHLWRQLDVSRHQVASLQAQVDPTAASAPQAATAATTAPTASPLAAPTVAAAPAAPPTALTNANQVLAVATIRTQSPEGIADAKIFQRGKMPTEYPDVGKVVGLSPDEVTRLYDLLTEQAVRQLTLDTSVPGSLDAHAQSERNELASLLGSKYEKWQKYTTELPTRRQMRDLAAVLSAAGTPLSDAQLDLLIPAAVAADETNTQERAAKFGRRSKSFALSRYSPEANQKMLSAVAGYLTPQQLESYRQMLERASGMESRFRDSLLGAQK